VTTAASMSGRTSKKLSVFTYSSCRRVLMLRAAYPLADRARAITCRGEGGEIAAAAMHLQDDRRLGGQLVLRLPERGLNLEAIDRLDRQEPQ
jgi:hypothetical protein